MYGRGETLLVTVTPFLGGVGIVLFDYVEGYAIADVSNVLRLAVLRGRR